MSNKKKQIQYFTADQVDRISDIETLRPEKWKEASFSERILALQECEKRISTFENRPAREVEVYSPEDPSCMGEYSKKKQKIFISEKVVALDSPYRPVYVLVEESHHAFQHYALTHPGYYRGPFMKEWKENDKDYKEHGKEYLEQPIEKTAKDAAAEVKRALMREHLLQKSLEQLDEKLKKGKQYYSKDLAQDIEENPLELEELKASLKEAIEKTRKDVIQKEQMREPETINKTKDEQKSPEKSTTSGLEKSQEKSEHNITQQQQKKEPNRNH
jgi:hypothetical protein